MKLATFEDTAIELNRARARHEMVRAHFDRFLEEAKLLADPACPAKGIAVEDVDGVATIRFLYTTVRVSMEFDRVLAKGIIHAETVTTGPGNVQLRETVARIAFDAAGETEFEGGYTNGKVSLQLVPDCKLLALHIVDVATSSRAIRQDA